jgi:hypothetical protein
MADAALFGDAAPPVATEAAKREALERELKLRRQVYPGRVARGRMTEAQAQHQIWLIEQILKDYQERAR